jgi:hypothetical protein
MLKDKKSKAMYKKILKYCKDTAKDVRKQKGL